MNADSYARQLKQLLPRGALWLLDVTSGISALLLAISDELARVDSRVSDFLRESDPRTATETLPDWERILALPDEVVTEIPATDAERRLAITQKDTALGGQDTPYYVAIAATCGYTVSIVQGYSGTVLRSGFRSGSRVYGTVWAFVWKVVVQPPAGTALTHAQLEAAIRRASPAHTTVFFEYL